MAPQATSPLLLLLLCFILLGNNHVSLSSVEGKKSVLILDDFKNLNQKTTTNILSSRCLSQRSRQSNGATILEVVHRDQCSSVQYRKGGRRRSWNDEARQQLISDNARVQSLQSQLKKPDSMKLHDDDMKWSSTDMPLSSGIRLQTLNYIVTIQLGSRKMSVIVDTGSDLTWVQCLPCRVCYSQQDPIFNPSISTSYKSVPCNSSICQSLLSYPAAANLCGGGGGNSITDSSSCNYAVSYGDGSYSHGEVGLETLQLGKGTVNNFVFGCGRNNKGLFGGASGLMGLGRSRVSLVSQTSNVFGGVFSYCLPSSSSSSGSLAFGGSESDHSYNNSTLISFTYMIPNPQLPTFYFLNLTGVSVGGEQQLQEAFGGGILLIIDSGTVITRLPPSIYGPLKAELLKQFSGYPTAPSFSILDTCFNLSSYQQVDIPDITMHFLGDADMSVDVNGVFYFAKSDASQVCLAIASLTYEDDIGIIGNYQQKNQRVIYDTKASRLGFARETCAFN